MRRASSLWTLAGLALAAAVPAAASTIAPPANLGELARVSRAVVLADARGSATELRGETPTTVTRFDVVRQVAGEAVGLTLELRVLGGEAEGVGLAVQGAPRFEEGGRYLLFLDRAGDGVWRPRMLSYGLLKEGGDGVLRPLPEAARLHLVSRPGVEPVGSYRTAELLPRLAAAAAGGPWQASAAGRVAGSKADGLESSLDGSEAAASGAALENVFDAGVVVNAPAVCDYLDAGIDNLPIRWFGFETGPTPATTSIWHTTPGQTGIADGGVAAVTEGLAAWNNHADSVINFNYAGSRARTPGCDPDPAIGFARRGVNEVAFNDPCNQLPALASCGGTLPAGWTNPCCGEVAVGGVFYNANPDGIASYDGQNWRKADSPFVIVNDGAQCMGATDFKEMMTHQLGHGLGFWHHNDANATMFAELGVHAPRGAAIAATDRACASAAYHTFLDVPYTYLFWPHIEAVENAGITKGCGTPGSFCPTTFITRAQMAIFLVRATRGAAFVPPPATGLFEDVPATYWAADYIEQLFQDGLTKGCSVSPARFCPEALITRSQMAVFLMRVEHGANFVPPPATGVFDDVPASYWAGAEIEQIQRDGITNGCSASPPRFCPENQVNRGSMAAFLQRAFDLPLPQ